VPETDRELTIDIVKNDATPMMLGIVNSKTGIKQRHWFTPGVDYGDLYVC